MAEFASKGVAGAGLGLGIAGTALGLLNGGLGLFGNPAARGFAAGMATDEILTKNHGVYGCGTPYGLMGESTPVNRYELGLEKELLEKDDVIAKLQAEQYTDRAVVALAEKVECRFDKMNDRFEHRVDKLNEKFEHKVDKLAEKTTYKFECVESQIAHQNVVNANLANTLACQAGVIATLQGLTKTIIPLDSLCPEAMPRFNQWVAPTATAEAQAALLKK